jgi:hypothetical protein
MSTPRLFGGAKGNARRNEHSAFFQRDEARRRFLQSNLYPGFAERVARRIGETAAWVYRRVEGHAAMSAALEVELLTEVPPEAAVRRLREDAAKLGFAVAQIPGATGIENDPVAQLASTIPALARAAESAVNALVDGVISADELGLVRQDAETAVVLIENAVATFEVAAGTRLL